MIFLSFFVKCEEEKSDLGRELQEKIESIRYNKDAQDTEVTRYRILTSEHPVEVEVVLLVV